LSNLDGFTLETKMIMDELRNLRGEVAAMHQETRATLVAIREMFDELRRVETAEFNIEHELEDVSNRLGEAIAGPGPSLTTCAVCGSDVQRHVAENGILLICRACGHTAFADRREGTERRNTAERRGYPQHGTTDDPPVEAPDSRNWISDQT
jgi:hypothetical protein